ncbi:MAG TPA: hypothetical protein VMH00_10145 [Candidatus Limnocylindrales bacterium]|nr:hypothetical protein [Candidatus Limnocylindrales bacterium]
MLRRKNFDDTREIPDKAFRDSIFFEPYKWVAQRGEYFWWRLRGSPRPKVPHIIKQRTLAEFARRFGLQVMVETGTNLGNMINAQMDRFREIYSIELDTWLAARAKRKFAAYPNIHLYQGDSGKVLPTIIPNITEPALFWLDAHWGAIDAPIKIELDCIYHHPIHTHVLLIDDARYFDGSNRDYPSIDQLRAHAASEYPGSTLEVKDDIIRIYKPR